jgi:flagellar hook protein FlgE
MLRSLFAGISGLRVNQTALDVTGNNIANANTVGFKSSSTVFSDTLSQMLTAASAPSASSGGTNAIQIGLGTQLAAVKTNFTQGANETTGVGTDMMVNGDGFFVVTDGTSNYLTRAGSFSFDSAGNMVAPDGKFVQGYTPVDYTTSVNSLGNTSYPPEYNDATGSASATASGPGIAPLNLATLTANALSQASSAVPGFTGSEKLQSYEIGRDGTITGTFDNGQKLALGQVAIANVRNPQGLEKAGDSEYLESANSGQVEYAAAGGTTTYGQNGSLTVGSLEMSNVDLSSEFTNLIIAQRGFEASSKVITTSDTVLGDLINMVH